MKLNLRGHDDRYAIEQSLLAFFPEERPVYEGEDGDSHAEVTLHEGNVYATGVTTLTYGGKTARGEARVRTAGVSDAYERERLRQRALKLSFFRAARDVTGVTPSWGALTGIRPAKLVRTMLEDGMTPAQADRVLRDTYCVSPARRRLALESAEAGLKARSDLRPEDISLYIGIPFCPTRCAYCSFVSQSVERTLGLVEPYLEVLHREITDAARMVQETGLHIKSFYMGGGTPTTLSADQMDRLLTHLNRSFDLSGCVEYCIEAGRPDTIDREKLQVLLDHGVDRISVNPQSLEDHVLTAIGRRHTAQQTVDAFHLAREAGFTNINMDLIVGLPGDTYETFCDTIEKVIALDPENVTVHALALKRSSFITQSGEINKAHADAALADRMMAYAEKRLTERGLEPYYLYRQSRMAGNLENTGWAKPGTECAYNIFTMDETETVLACGAGGVTKLKNPYSEDLSRIFNFKYSYEYISRYLEILERKEGIAKQYEQFRKRLH